MEHETPFTYDEKEYDLSHLQPIEFDITLKAHKTNPELKILINVVFSNHCYTEGVTTVSNASHNFLDHNNQRRWFSPARHESSGMLPGLVKQLHTKKCCFTGRTNWLIIELQGSDGKDIPFHVFFSIWKNKKIGNSLCLCIDSAYFKTKGDNSPTRRNKMDRISFAMLARKTLQGKPIKRPSSIR